MKVKAFDINNVNLGEENNKLFCGLFFFLSF